MTMKNSLVIAAILLSIFASDAFAVLRPAYPAKPYPPDHVIIIGDEENHHAAAARQ
jgi:hypothetical protein